MIHQPSYEALGSLLSQCQRDNGKQRSRIAELDAENRRLRGLLIEAATDIEDWGAYAGIYFQEKHGLAEDVARYRNAALQGVSDE